MTDENLEAIRAELDALRGQVQRRRGGKLRWLRLTVIGACMFAPVAVLALPVRVDFTAGQLIKASEVNSNFTNLWNAVTALEGRGVPVGTVIAYAGPIATIPSGWLLCDGSPLSRTTTYAQLYAAIGTVSGGGDNVTTFNLPDYRGRFLRGVDDPDGPGGTVAAGRDADAAGRQAANANGNTGALVGTVQADQLKSHSHGITDPGHAHGLSIYITYTGQVPAANASTGTYSGKQNTDVATTGITIDSTGGSETRPANAYVNYIIKY
jgi:microcystin-dependent protein